MRPWDHITSCGTAITTESKTSCGSISPSTPTLMPSSVLFKRGEACIGVDINTPTLEYLNERIDHLRGRSVVAVRLRVLARRKLGRLAHRHKHQQEAVQDVNGLAMHACAGQDAKPVDDELAGLFVKIFDADHVTGRATREFGPFLIGGIDVVQDSLPSCSMSATDRSKV